MFDIKTLIESSGNLYRTTIPSGESFVWRLLTLKEYNAFRGLREAKVLSPLELYEAVFNHCFIGDSDAINGDLPAGYFCAMGELIMHLSGDGSFSSERDEIDNARLQYPMNSVQETMKRIILIAFPGYLPENIDNWTRPELLKKFVLAEAVLVNKGDYEPLDTKKIQSAAEAAKKQKIDFARENRELQQKLGAGDNEHILDQPIEVLAQKQRHTQRLEQREAQALERAMKRGR